MNQSILGELDQLIGDFLELSGKQYIVTSTLTVKNHAVDIQETEALEPVNRSTFDPVFMTIPEPTEYAGEGLWDFKYSTVTENLSYNQNYVKS